MRIIIVFISIFFFFNNFSFAKSYKVGDKISDRIELYKKYTFELPDGDWTIADKFSYSYYGIISKGYTLLRIKNNKAIESFEIAELKAPGRFQDIINIALVEIMFKNKYDGCYERPEYYKLEFFAKGSTHNCFWILHLDVYKELNDPDDPELRGANTQLKAWIRENNIKLPEVAVGSLHSYFSRLTGGKWFVIEHFIDPEILGAPKSKFVKEDRSEYHKHNISEHPEHKKVMDKVLSIGAERHKKFEIEVKAKEHHKLNLDNYIANSSNKKDNDDDVISQIKKLDELFKSGVINEKEFKKAKEKVLN